MEQRNCQKKINEWSKTRGKKKKIGKRKSEKGQKQETEEKKIIEDKKENLINGEEETRKNQKKTET